MNRQPWTNNGGAKLCSVCRVRSFWRKLVHFCDSTALPEPFFWGGKLMEESLEAWHYVSSGFLGFASKRVWNPFKQVALWYPIQSPQDLKFYLKYSLAQMTDQFLISLFSFFYFVILHLLTFFRALHFAELYFFFQMFYFLINFFIPH